jgi:hypothetical protein
MKTISKYYAAELIAASAGEEFQVKFQGLKGVKTLDCKIGSRFKPAAEGAISVISGTRYQKVDLEKLLEIDINGDQYTVDRW